MARRTHRRRPARRPASNTAPRRAVLLRAAGPVRQRRPAQRPGRPDRRPARRTGYDPTDKGFYHGGDLKGLIDRLDYIKGLGTTAIWLAPIFKNQPVQGTRRRRLGRLPRLLDHRLHPGRPALRHQRGPEAAGQGARTSAASRSSSTSSPTTPPTSSTTREDRTPTSTRRPPVHRREGRAVRRRRLRRRQPTASRRWTPLLPVHAGRSPAAKTRRQGPVLAERPDDVPQPGRLHLRRREHRRTATSSASTTCGPSVPRWSAA